MQGLYAIVDVATLTQHDLCALRFTEAVLAAAPAAVQLRDKRLGSAPTLKLLRQLHRLTAVAGVPLFGNDRADLAALAGCEGVHVGQHDLPVPLARQVARRAGRGELLVGMSAHNEAELTRALAQQPDYVAFGPVFATTSKAQPDPTLGLEGLRRLVDLARPSGLPVVAIGGISAANATRVARSCGCAAVIGGLLPAAMPTGKEAVYAAVAERATALGQALKESRRSRREEKC